MKVQLQPVTVQSQAGAVPNTAGQPWKKMDTDVRGCACTSLVVFQAKAGAVLYTGCQLCRRVETAVGGWACVWLGHHVHSHYDQVKVPGDVQTRAGAVPYIAGQPWKRVTLL